MSIVHVIEIIKDFQNDNKMSRKFKQVILNWRSVFVESALVGLAFYRFLHKRRHDPNQKVGKTSIITAT